MENEIDFEKCTDPKIQCLDQVFDCGCRIRFSTVDMLKTDILHIFSQTLNFCPDHCHFIKTDENGSQCFMFNKKGMQIINVPEKKTVEEIDALSNEAPSDMY